MRWTFVGRSCHARYKGQLKTGMCTATLAVHLSANSIVRKPAYRTGAAARERKGAYVWEGIKTPGE